MKVTLKRLGKLDACSEAVVEFEKQGFKSIELNDLIKWLIKNHKSNGEYLAWGNWLIVRGMKRKQSVRYACYAAKKVLVNFESVYPDDKRPR